MQTFYDVYAVRARWKSRRRVAGGMIRFSGFCRDFRTVRVAACVRRERAQERAPTRAHVSKFDYNDFVASCFHIDTARARLNGERRVTKE